MKYVSTARIIADIQTYHLIPCRAQNTILYPIKLHGSFKEHLLTLQQNLNTIAEGFFL